MKKIIFVCTGNTCRSPMAEALFNTYAKESGLDAFSESYGICADGSKISDNAKAVLTEAGIDFSHTSAQITEDVIKDADMVFGITSTHSRTLCAMFPSDADKIYNFPTDISDPYGADIDVYRKCRNEISEGIKSILGYLKNEQ